MNGNGKIESLLERIADRLEAMDAGQERLRHDMNVGFSAVNQRIDNSLAIGGKRYLDHEERIQALEQRVLGKSGKLG